VRLVEVSGVTWPATTATRATVHPPFPPRSRPAPDRSRLPSDPRAQRNYVMATARVVEIEGQLLGLGC
jgi:hypothetical protein